MRNVSSTVISFITGAVGAIITMILMPWLQHWIWGYQRRGELRLSSAKEFNRLSADFVIEYSKAPKKYQPEAPFWKALLVVTADVKALFPDTTYEAFKRLESLIGPGSPGLGPEGKATISDFIEARNAALRALYAEVIPLGPWWRFWDRKRSCERA